MLSWSRRPLLAAAVATGETIYALASGNLPSAVAIVRVSGPQALTSLHHLLRRPPVIKPRTAALCTLYDPLQPTRPLDRGLITTFPSPASYTGEDVVEYQLHGGPAVVSAVMASLSSLGLRPASAGEFTRRALHNGKLDLTSVEGISDLIRAETEQQRRAALASADGHVRRRLEAWREELLRARAHMMALIDFGEVDEVPPDVWGAVKERVEGVRFEVLGHLRSGVRGELLRHGALVVLVGAPNVGKSSWLNLLADRQAAITSPEAGTTRDVVEVALDLGGWPCRLADTAGIRPEAGSAIEREGMRRAINLLNDAAVKVAVVAYDPPGGEVEKASLPPVPPFFSHETREFLSQVAPHVVLVNKAEALSPAGPEVTAMKAALTQERGGEGVVVIGSATTRLGVEELTQAIISQVKKAARTGDSTSGEGLVVKERHRVHLQACIDACDRFLSEGDPTRVELADEELAGALYEIGMITGAVGLEELLDVVFSDFCIGK